jgi:NAD(P)-dependent dehydrogenase (short-subunit alcohol dehydrogenase family)
LTRVSGFGGSDQAPAARPSCAGIGLDQLDARRAELRATLPIGRVVEPTDVAAPAAHLMTNTALTGATYDIDGGQQLLSNRGGTR